ncbi:hypothetical protein FOPE_07146 [Fonsecaea pedrosoi]|nr:hypothetical protein FOPE_07146 [Fonsecaea pedrosoi]
MYELSYAEFPPPHVKPQGELWLWKPPLGARLDWTGPGWVGLCLHTHYTRYSTRFFGKGLSSTRPYQAGPVG